MTGCPKLPSIRRADDVNWFAVRCILQRNADESAEADYIYEERITIWSAASSDEAIAAAEAEATEYAGLNAATYINLAQAFDIQAAIPASGTEVFSLMRESNLEADDYLDAYFDTGEEREEENA